MTNIDQPWTRVDVSEPDECAQLRQRIAELQAENAAMRDAMQKAQNVIEAAKIVATQIDTQFDSARRASAAWKRAAVARRARDELATMGWTYFDNARYDRLEAILRKAEAGTP